MQHSVNFPALLPLNVFGGEVSHGGGQTRHSWGGTAQALAAQGWYAVAYDHRGHGDSDWSGDSLYDMAHFALDMACLARSFDHPSAVLGAVVGVKLMGSSICNHPIRRLRDAILANLKKVDLC